jgi:hypothetical protein
MDLVSRSQTSTFKNVHRASLVQHLRYSSAAVHLVQQLNLQHTTTELYPFRSATRACPAEQALSYAHLLPFFSVLNLCYSGPPASR